MYQINSQAVKIFSMNTMKTINSHFGNMTAIFAMDVVALTFDNNLYEIRYKKDIPAFVI